MEAKSIHEWVGGPGRTYESNQRRFLNLNVSDFFEYLESARRDGRARTTYEEIPRYISCWKENMRIGGLLRRLYEILQVNSGCHSDESAEAKAYDWALKVVFQVMIEPCHDLHIKGRDAYAEVINKVDRFSKGGKK